MGGEHILGDCAVKPGDRVQTKEGERGYVQELFCSGEFADVELDSGRVLLLSTADLRRV